MVEAERNRGESFEQAVKQADSAQPIERVLRGLGERIGVVADARSIFGQPVTHGDVTVIPVARAFGGFGGGGGADVPKAGIKPGLGAGAGFVTMPVGFIEISDGRARFRRLNDTGLGLVGGALVDFAWRALTRLLPQKK